jgi:hypothetical protein
MKLTKLYRDTAKVADVALVANSGSIVIYTHSVRDEEEICDGIVRAVNAHDALIEPLKRSQELFEKALPRFDWGNSPLTAEAIKLLNEVPIQVSAALALAEKGETS